jgi:hypothetical protein
MLIKTFETGNYPKLPERRDHEVVLTIAALETGGD